jgi:hypothetical protein
MIKGQSSEITEHLHYWVQILIEEFERAISSPLDNSDGYPLARFHRRLTATFFVLNSKGKPSDRETLREFFSDIVVLVENKLFKGRIEAKDVNERLLHYMCLMGFELDNMCLVLELSEEQVILQMKTLSLNSEYEKGLKNKYNQEISRLNKAFQLKFEKPFVGINPFGQLMKELLSREESQVLEFKSSLNRDMSTSANFKSKITRMAAIKTIAAFLNDRGGNLLIGVDDNKNILGIENDMKAFDVDKYQLGLLDLLKSYLVPYIPHLLTLHSQPYENKFVAVVSVNPSKEPTHVVSPASQREPNEPGMFFVRDGNRTIELKGSDKEAFIKSRF